MQQIQVITCHVIAEVVPRRRLELPLPYRNQHLKLARLPIPPSGPRTCEALNKRMRAFLSILLTSMAYIVTQVA